MTKKDIDTFTSLVAKIDLYLRKLAYKSNDPLLHMFTTSQMSFLHSLDSILKVSFLTQGGGQDE